MRRTIEKLAQERASKEEAFRQGAEKLRKKIGDFSPAQDSSRLDQALAQLGKPSGVPPAASPSRKRRLFGNKRRTAPPADFFGRTAEALQEMKELVERHIRESRESLVSIIDLIEKQSALGDARDREWDALGSNHVGMIFKSMEWRVDKLAAGYEDVQILMKKFFLLRERLDALLRSLETHQTADPSDVRALLDPLEDWKYAGFENRFRGSEDEIRKEQAGYLSHFKKGGKILDLGCGRGEFLELLREHGFHAEGVDLNGQMIDICLDKGLNCSKGDLLERLAEEEDGALDGIFSSQVIEHLPPSYLKRMIETAYAKLTSGGVVVLETVNPVSVFALVQIYYLDLSHQKPIHPQAIQFMLESAGFENVETRYSSPLNEEKLREIPGADEKTSVMNRNIDRLNELLFAPPNYAVLGHKH